MGHTSYIDTIDGKNLDELMPNYLNSEIPVILKGAASEWPAVQKWNAKYLTERIGETPITYRMTHSHFHPNLDSDFLMKTVGFEKPSYVGEKPHNFENCQRFFERRLQSFFIFR